MENKLLLDKNTTLAVVLGKDTSGQDIIPISTRLTLKTNRHPNTDGTEWGWIEGCTKNICWSDSTTKFNRLKATKLVQSYNATLALAKRIDTLQ